MVYNTRLLGLLVFAIAAIMLLPAGSATTAAAPALVAPTGHSVAPAPLSAAPAAVAASPSTPAMSSAASAQSRIISELKADHISSDKAFLPNFGTHFSTAGGVVSPLYTNAPAPMGLGDFGVTEVHGVNVGTISYTQSVEGSVTLNAVNPIYVTSSDPDGFTMQLNTVLTHTDVLGDAVYQYWIQNVPIYQPASSTLSFENNIWNFSSPTAGMQVSSIYSGSGTVFPGVYYYAPGPSFHITMPFTVEVWNNATVTNDRPTVYFNYTVASGSGVISGSYDQVEFNSSATPPTTPAPSPTFQINGQSAGPTNFLLNDAEIMLGGPGGGSTTTLFGISGSMGLWTLNNGSSTMTAVPGAYDFGTDTGETSEGIAEYATTGSNPVAELNAGPSILYPLWGVKGAHQGAETITVNLAPTNAFVFASVGGKFSASTSGWGPTAVSGPTTYWLSPNKYTFEFLLSDYTPVVAHVARGSSASLTVSMSWNPSEGVYTPLWAQANSQLAAISIPGGLGNTLHPYYLLNNPGTINQLFASFNDYEFPVFPGVYLLHTTDRVNVYDMPSFGVSYPNTVFGSPLSNQLNIELFDTQHVSIVANPDLSGWFYNADSFGEPAAVYAWDASQTLIAGNTFYVESNGINMVDALGFGGHNVIWGNVFYPTTVVATNPTAVLNAGSTVALWEFESNDVIYNNAFLTPYTTLSFDESFYTGAFMLWTDEYNVHLQSASNVRVVNGWDLSGDILGLSWVGGNYWNNYGTFPNAYGHPYDNGGLIQSGEDHLPQTLVTLYRVWVHETGLPSGTSWSVTVNGFTESTTGNGVGFWMADGAAYAWSAGAVTGYTASPAVGAVLVSGANAHFTITYT